MRWPFERFYEKLSWIGLLMHRAVCKLESIDRTLRQIRALLLTPPPLKVRMYGDSLMRFELQVPARNVADVTKGLLVVLLGDRPPIHVEYVPDAPQTIQHPGFVGKDGELVSASLTFFDDAGNASKPAILQFNLTDTIPPPTPTEGFSFAIVSEEEPAPTPTPSPEPEPVILPIPEPNPEPPAA